MAAPSPCLPGVSVAFVRDWMTVYGGADHTMAAALELFPAAPIHTLVYQPEHFQGTDMRWHDEGQCFWTLHHEGVFP